MTTILTPHDINGLTASELDQLDSFRYESASGSFTARKETRKTTDKAYWTAYKRKFGKLRKAYIGDSSQLFSDKLDEIVAKLNASDSEFWNNRPGYVAEKKRRSQSGLSEVTQQDTQQLNRVGELTEQLNNATKEIHQITNALIDAKDRIAFLERRLQETTTTPPTNSEALRTLEQALTLKPNAGGAIKAAIRKALELMKLPNVSQSLPNTLSERPLRSISKKHEQARQILNSWEDRGELTRQEVTALSNKPSKAYKFLEGKGYRYSNLDGWSKS